MPEMKSFYPIAFCVTVALCLVAPTSRAQKNEAAFLAGVTLTPGQSAAGRSIGFDPSLAFQIEYNRRILPLPVGSLLVGLDFAASPLDVKDNSGPSETISQYAYLFLTPELRYEGPMIRGFKPWASVGGGFADFSEGKLRNGLPAPRSGTKTGVAEVSAGADVQTPLHLLVPIGFRFEARDYISGKPQYNVNTGGGVQNQVLLTGGIVLHF